MTGLVLKRLLVRGLVVSIVIGTPGCRTDADDPTLASIDKPVRAQLLHKGAAQTGVTLHIHSEPPVIIDAAHCSDVTGEAMLAADDDGKRYAYRCGDHSWYAVFVGSEGRAFELAESVWQGALLKWRAVPTFEESLEKLFRSYGYDRRAKLLEEVEAALGADKLASVLVVTANAEPRGNQDQLQHGGAWGLAFERLPEAARSKASKTIRHAALEASDDANAELLVRALMHGSLGDSKRAAALRGRIEDMLGPDPGPSPLVRELLRALVGADSSGAASIGCRLFDRVVKGEWKGRGDAHALARVAVWAVAEARIECTAISEFLAAHACDPLVRCSGKSILTGVPPQLHDPLCTVEETDGLLGSIRREPDYSALSEDTGKSELPTRLALGAALRAGALDPVVERKNARRQYAIEGEVDACPPAELLSAVCELSIEASSGRVEGKACTFRVDDRKRTIRVSDG